MCLGTCAQCHNHEFVFVRGHFIDHNVGGCWDESFQARQSKGLIPRNF